MPVTDLPREIRLAIFSLVISPDTEPPEIPAASQNRVRLRNDTAVWIPASRDDVALPLLLTCRTFNSDVRDVRSRRPGPYVLDIMLVRWCGLWPTWLSVPDPTRQHMGTLCAQFRLFDPPEDRTAEFCAKFDQRGSYGVYSGNGGGLLTPLKTNWDFYLILNAVLGQGPQGLSRQWASRELDVPLPPRCTVRTLVLDVLTPSRPLQVIRDSGGPRARRERVFTPPARLTGNDATFPYTALDRYLLPGPQDPELGAWAGFTRVNQLWRLIEYHDKVALYLANALWALLIFQPCVLQHEDMALNGIILYENILDAIEIRVDGVLRRRYDVEKLLEDVASPDKLAWKEWARERRRRIRLGLPVRGPRVEIGKVL